jgi:hypothetical protein
MSERRTVKRLVKLFFAVCAAPMGAHQPVGARAYDVTAVLTFSAAAARGALARGVCLDELSTKHSIRPDF